MRTIMNNITITNDFDSDEVVVDSDTIIVIELEEVERDLTINVMPNNCLRVFDCGDRTHNNITYNIGDNANVVVNKLSKDSCDKVKYNIMGRDAILDVHNSIINYGNNSYTVTYNMNGRDSILDVHNSIINYGKNTYTVTLNHKDEHSTSKIINHAINVNNEEFKFIVDGVIDRNAIDTSLRQDNKIVNLKEGKSFILPNLIVDNSEIEAEHAAYIGSFDEDKVFYLESRGITYKDAENLLIKAFLLNNMELEEKEKDIVVAKIENI